MDVMFEGVEVELQERAIRILIDAELEICSCSMSDIHILKPAAGQEHTRLSMSGCSRCCKSRRVGGETGI